MLKGGIVYLVFSLLKSVGFLIVISQYKIQEATLKGGKA
jgi:hypothetical protein